MSRGALQAVRGDRFARADLHTDHALARLGIELGERGEDHLVGLIVADEHHRRRVDAATEFGQHADLVHVANSDLVDAVAPQHVHAVDRIDGRVRLAERAVTDGGLARANVQRRGEGLVLDPGSVMSRVAMSARIVSTRSNTSLSCSVRSVLRSNSTPCDPTRCRVLGNSNCRTSSAIGRPDTTATSMPARDQRSQRPIGPVDQTCLAGRLGDGGHRAVDVGAQQQWRGQRRDDGGELARIVVARVCRDGRRHRTVASVGRIAVGSVSS